MCFVYFIIFMINKKKNTQWKQLKDNFFTVFLFLYSYFQPNLVQYMIQTFSCRKIAGLKYVSADISVECYSQEHQYTIFLNLAGFIIWTAIIPFYIYTKLRDIKNLDSIASLQKFGFYYIEYKNKSRFWELLKIYFKTLIILTSNILNEQPITQFMFLLLFLLVYQFLVKQNMPYETLLMNRIGIYAIYSLAFFQFYINRFYIIKRKCSNYV